MIRAEHLHKTFDNLRVLVDINFKVQPASITAVLGPNASGKSTLIKSILGLVNPDSGAIYIQDQPVLGTWDYRQLIGYMPQIAKFPENLRVHELFQMITDIRNHGAEVDDELISLFSLGEHRDRPLRVLSGGTRQKINAAIAFMFSPEILVLDEPTAGLDPISIEILREKIAKEKERGKTVILTSHNMNEVDEIADHILFLLDGKTCFDGSLWRLKQHTKEARLERAIVSLMENVR
jgi:Cu-processing system ATP-binding protein